MQLHASAAAPKLSICIITYNRAEYLRQTLLAHARMQEFAFDYEIIVSDNCSSDHTATVVSELAPELGKLRYIRQTHTISPEANVVAAFRLAKGEFVVYLADDDALIPKALAAVIDYMDDNPSVVACYSSWELWDNVSDTSRGLFYQVDETAKFEKKDMLKLFDLVIQRHIFPEIGIYRGEMMHGMLYQPRKAYWAYVWLARALEYGDVAFLHYPFYRSITRHWEGETRQQHGHRQTLSEWDLYRGGIEYLLQKATNSSGASGVPQNRLDYYRESVNRFVATRMKVALRLFIEAGDYLSASDTLARLLPWGYLREKDIERYRQLLPIRAAAQAIVATFDAITTLRQIGLYRIADSEKLVTLLRKIRNDLPIAGLSADNPAATADKDQILAVVRSAADRHDLVRAGFEAGLIIVEAELLSQFQL